MFLESVLTNKFKNERKTQCLASPLLKCVIKYLFYKTIKTLLGLLWNLHIQINKAC